MAFAMWVVGLCRLLCRGGGPGASASSDILGARGLMLVEALDASCGTHELPPYDDTRPSKQGRTAEPTAQQLFWAPQPLRQFLRSCAGGAPHGGQPWKRLPSRVESVAPPTASAANMATPAAGAAPAAGAGAGRTGPAASVSVATPLVLSPAVMSPAAATLASPPGVMLSENGSGTQANNAGSCGSGMRQSESPAGAGGSRM